MATILVVDDSPHALGATRRFLETRGHDVQAASNAAAALKLLEKETPDLMMFDLVLPDIDGVDLLELARKKERLASVPAVAMSALPMRLEELQRGTNPFQGYLAKPYEPDELFGVVNGLLPASTPTRRRIPTERRTPTAESDLAQMHEDMSRRYTALSDHMRALTSLAETMSTASDADAAMERGLRGCVDALRANLGLLYLLEEGELRFVAHSGGHDATLADCFGDQRGLWRALQENEVEELGRMPQMAGATAYAVPLALPRPMGVLVLALPGRMREEEQRLTVRAVVSQFGQGLALARSITQARRSEEYFRSLIENAHEILIVLETNGRIRYASPSVERFLSFKNRDFVGRPMTNFTHPQDGSPWENIATDGQVQDIEMRMCDASGTWHTVEGVAYSRCDDPSVGGIILNVRDVTDRRRADEALRLSELQLRQTQKMDALGKLAGGVAHDFNNLVTAINGFSILLKRTISGNDPRSEYLSEILSAGDRAASLTRQLLAFSRNEMVSFDALNLNRIVSDVERMLRRLIGEDIQVLVTLEPDLQTIKADIGQMEQVLINLAVNARDAMPQGGGLYITTANVVVDEEMARANPGLAVGPHVMLAVGDTGCGMDEQTIARIFEPFFTTKETGKGTGLGLSTVYGIVKATGGHVSVSSTVGQGTLFKVYLPQTTEAAVLTVDVDEPQVEKGTETILLVEDEITVRKLASSILRRDGYTVIEAGDGIEALKMCREFKGNIDLLLTDVVMPKMSGRVLAEHVEQIQPNARVLYASGYTDDAVMRHGICSRKMSFLPKPFKPESLIRTVREVLDRRAGVAGAAGVSRSA